MNHLEAVDANYVDDGALREQDRVSLPIFLADKDRAQLTERGQPFFSGREREINAFRSIANALFLGRPGNATLAVEGPPGAGKSALMAQFQEEMRTLSPTGSGERRWLPVLLNGARAECPQAIAQAVDEAIAKRLAQDLMSATGADSTDREERFRAFLGEGGAKRAKQGVRTIAESMLQRGFSVMGFQLGAAPSGLLEDIEAVSARRSHHWNEWQIILLIDEAQGISGQVPGAVPGTLSSIHQGMVSAPLSFCAFGLPGTWDALGDVGISRASVGHDLPLAGLDDRAAGMAVERCFARFGVTHGGAWQATILERSGHWPQHLATYLHAALTVLKSNAPSAEVMGDARRSPLTEAIALGDAGRKAYYGRRLQSLTRDNPLFRDYATDLAEKLQRTDRPPLESEITRNIMERHGISVESAAGFLRKAKHSGLLDTDDEGRCSMPIPSFAKHLLGEASRSPNRPETA